MHDPQGQFPLITSSNTFYFYCAVHFKKVCVTKVQCSLCLLEWVRALHLLWRRWVTFFLDRWTEKTNHWTNMHWKIVWEIIRKKAEILAYIHKRLPGKICSKYQPLLHSLNRGRENCMAMRLLLSLSSALLLGQGEPFCSQTILSPGYPSIC